MMMLLIVSCDLFSLAIIQVMSSGTWDNGNWTKDNAKGLIFLLLQQARQPKEMNICAAGLYSNM